MIRRNAKGQAPAAALSASKVLTGQEPESYGFVFATTPYAETRFDG